MINQYPPLLKLYFDWARELGCTRVSKVGSFVPTGIEVAMAVRPYSQTLTVHQGKGFTWVEACLSALGESVETALASNLPKEGLINVELLSSKTDRIVYRKLPVEKLAMSNSLRDLRDYGRTYSSSGGLAIHRTRCKALNHALEELVERPFAHQFMQQDTIEAKISNKILFTAIGHDVTQILQQRFTVIEANLLSSEPLYVVNVGIVAQDDLRGDLYFAGFAARSDIKNALRSALLEAVQSYITYVVGMRDDIPIMNNRDVSSYEEIVSANIINIVPQAKNKTTQNILDWFESRGETVGCLDLGSRSGYGVECFALKCVIMEDI